MTRASFHRKTVLLLLLAVLAAPLTSAAGPERAEARSASILSGSDLLDRLWSFLTSAWSETGCHLDPSGGCATEESPSVPETDEGCRLDPNGGCAS